MPNILKGTVTKAGAMAKTITVTITNRFEHPKYLKQIERTTKMQVHDELQEARLGDKVSITHTHPISASKHFYLSAINSRRTDEGNRAIPVQGGNPPTTRMVRAARRGGEASRAGALGAKGNVRATESGRKTSVLGAIKELISGSGASEEARK